MAEMRQGWKGRDGLPDSPAGARVGPMSPTRESIEAAARRLAGHIRRTPLLRLSDQLALKLEALQVSGSFKARGAFNRMLSAPLPAAGVVAASGGNHGAAVAHAARA